MKRFFTNIMSALLLMFFAFSSQAQFKPSDFSHKFLVGKINGNMSVRMLLNKKKRSKWTNKNNLTGYYYYTRNKGNVVMLEGTWEENGRMIIEGKVKVKGKYTKNGAFAGRWDKDAKKLIGTWTATGGKRSYPFELYETYNQGGLQAEMQWMDEMTMFGKKAPRGVSVSFLYPRMKGGKVAKIINTYVDENMLRNPQERAARFIKNFMEEHQEGSRISYSEDHLITVQTNEKNILTLAYDLNGFSGGAHGYYNTRYTSFDLRTGKELKMTDIFKPGFEQPVRKLITDQMRIEGLLIDLTTKKDYPLPKNFYFRPDGIAFFYNVYEIGPYVAGSRQVVVPYGKLKKYINRKSVLRKFMK